jgi:hypothetical protein
MNTVVEVDKQIDVKAYVTEEGLPTCAKDFTCGKFCRFLGTKNFGLNDVCMLSSQTRLLRREKDGDVKPGFIEPGDHCVVWTQDEIKKGVDVTKL